MMQFPLQKSNLDYEDDTRTSVVQIWASADEVRAPVMQTGHGFDTRV